jgi:hypothetical protein
LTTSSKYTSHTNGYSSIVRCVPDMALIAYEASGIIFNTGMFTSKIQEILSKGWGHLLITGFNRTRVAILLIITISVFSCDSSSNENNIYGEWNGIYLGRSISIIFNTDNSCIINYYDENGSNNFRGKYEIDWYKKPIPITIREINELNHPLATIIEFIDNDSIKVAPFSTKWRLRPISFDKNSINLARVNN